MANGDNGYRIPEPVVPEGIRQFVRFSFKHIDLQSTEFGPAHCCQEYLRCLVERLRHYSQWPLEEFLDQNNQDNRHMIDFRVTRFAEGFPNVNLDQLQYHEAWQFGLRRDRRWRVHGIVLGDTFFVIWLDPNHLLFPVEPQNQGN